MSNKSNNIIQFLILTLLVVGLPMGSWYYMDSGYNYYKNAMGELRDYGTMPDFSLKTQGDQLLTKELLQGKAGVVAFIDPDHVQTDQLMKDMVTMHLQFDKRDDFVFLFHVLSDEEKSDVDLIQLAEKYNLQDRAQCYFLTGTNQVIKDLAGVKYKIPDLKTDLSPDTPLSLTANSSGDLKDYPYLVLVDNKHTIRNYYDAYAKTSVGRMAEQVALILPMKAKDEKAVLQRVKEK